MGAYDPYMHPNIYDYCCLKNSVLHNLCLLSSFSGLYLLCFSRSNLGNCVYHFLMFRLLEKQQRVLLT